MAATVPAARLVADEPKHAGGTVAYRVVVDDRVVGLVGDGRAWRGWRYGTRKWWACHRHEGDRAARWDSDLAYSSRAAAVRALLERVNTRRS